MTDPVAGSQSRTAFPAVFKPARLRTDSRHVQLWRRSAVAKVDRQNGWPTGSA
jgi:hypothetical protein